MEQTSKTVTPKKQKQAELPVSATPKPKTRGIVLIALGHPYFSHMAYNLAVSIKYHDPKINIAIFQRENSLSELNDAARVMFDQILTMPDECVTGRFGYDPYKAKLHLVDISPYDETLYLDVDMILSPTKPIQGLFDEVSGKELMIANRGEIEIGKGSLRSMWVDLDEIKASYKVDKVYDLSSEVMWITKTEKVKKVFATARRVYDEYKFHVKQFGHGKPDEVYLMVALALEGVGLNPCPFQPTYWQPFYFSKIHNREFIHSHYAVSVGGAFVQRFIKKVYDSDVRHYFGRMGVVKAPYQIVNKASILKERSKI